MSATRSSAKRLVAPHSPFGFNALLAFRLRTDSARNGFESARPRDSMTVRMAAAHPYIIKIQMQNKHIHHYNGYAVQPSAHRLPDGTFSSNLLLERADSARADGLYQFYSLDYFADEEQALEHSARWAREWVDTRG
ncbi:hypothetical protein J2777_006187 [Paraburkholderia graminis]|jgi:hypothetical protein|nr:hypothetical protein [Paraburkholderia graminis]